MYKHVGKHNDKKVVVLYREIPGEAHMCLVVYSDLLPRLYHDATMKILESDIGQQAENFSDALFRSFMPDGRNCLEALHKDGLMKKVPTNQVIMTPTPKSSVRLDELNGLLNEMKKGADAIKRMTEIDASRGMTGKRSQNEPKEVNAPPASRVQPATVMDNNSALTDEDLAQSRLQQAASMKINAAQLLAEAERLITEAAELDPTTTTNAKLKASTPKKVKAKAS